MFTLDFSSIIYSTTEIDNLKHYGWKKLCSARRGNFWTVLVFRMKKNPWTKNIGQTEDTSQGFCFFVSWRKKIGLINWVDKVNLPPWKAASSPRSLSCLEEVR